MSASAGVAGLREALDALARVAGEAGVAPSTARAEGAALAAAVAESAPGAAGDWAEAVGSGSTQDFFDAATRARRWRAAPTTTLTELAENGSERRVAYAEALAEVASAACGLGEPTIRVIGNASVAAAAQLQVGGVTPAQNDSSGTRARGEALRDARLPFLGWQAGIPSSDADVSRPGRPDGVPPQGAADPAREDGAVEPQAPAVPPPRSLEELLAELDALTGLERVKREVHQQVAVLRVERLREEAGLRSPIITRHLVFVGNPGTGKTTVARLVSGIYRALGLLSKGQLVEVDRSELVAGYLGQTAVKTAEVVTSAIGGVLFVDEAYSLTGDQYGEEAIAALVKEMEDHRDDLVVIVAGYPLPMEAFVAANPGLASRFRTTIGFDDYTDEELVAILTGLAAAADYELAPETLDVFRAILASTVRGMTFGNGRFARNTLEAAIGRHAWRLRDVDQPTTQQLRLLLPEDLEDGPEPGEEGAP